MNFFVSFFILMIIVSLICYLLFTIIFLLCLCNVLFGLFVYCRLGALFLSHSLYIHIYIYAYFIVVRNQSHGLWLEAVAWTRRHCHYFVFVLIFLSVLFVKYLTYLTGFHCPVDSVSLRTTLM